MNTQADNNRGIAPPLVDYQAPPCISNPSPSLNVTFFYDKETDQIKVWNVEHLKRHGLTTPPTLAFWDRADAERYLAYIGADWGIKDELSLAQLIKGTKQDPVMLCHWLCGNTLGACVALGSESQDVLKIEVWSEQRRLTPTMPELLTDEPVTWQDLQRLAHFPDTMLYTYGRMEGKTLTVCIRTHKSLGRLVPLCLSPQEAEEHRRHFGNPPWEVVGATIETLKVVASIKDANGALALRDGVKPIEQDAPPLNIQMIPADPLDSFGFGLEGR